MSVLTVPHGEINLPVFLPDATRAVVRSVGSEDVANCGIKTIMVNLFHLMSKPGARTVARLGGIHAFMNWQAPLAIDSGGFQVFSLLTKSPDLGSVTRRGFVYRLEKGGKKILLTPDKCVQNQMRLGGDILFCLDYCTHPESPSSVQRTSVDLTIEWARQCRRELDHLLQEKQSDSRPLLFAVVQGGDDLSLRRECAERLMEIGFDGYGYGGYPVRPDGSLAESVQFVAETVPADKPRFALGIGKPESIVRAFRMGYQLFDCVLPTRDARHLRLYVWNEPTNVPLKSEEGFYKYIYMQDTSMLSDSSPIDERCDCLCCRSYSRGYLHHLFRIGDALALRLATIHNLRFYARLIERLQMPMGTDVR